MSINFERISNMKEVTSNKDDSKLSLSLSFSPDDTVLHLRYL